MAFWSWFRRGKERGKDLHIAGALVQNQHIHDSVPAPIADTIAFCIDKPVRSVSPMQILSSYNIAWTSYDISYTEMQSQSQSRLLACLPRELVLYIATFLPASAKTAFALTSKTALQILGENVLRCLAMKRLTPFSSISKWPGKKERSEDEIERQNLCVLLHRETRELIYCFVCHALHWLKTPEDTWPNSFVYCATMAEVKSVYSQCTINFLYIYILLKYHCMGRSMEKYLRQMTEEQSWISADKALEVTHDFRFSQFPYRRLYLKTTHKLSIAAEKGSLQSSAQYLQEACWRAKSFLGLTNPYLDTFQCRLSHFPSVWCGDCYGLRK